jgi:hypothetical protein
VQLDCGSYKLCVCVRACARARAIASCVGGSLARIRTDDRDRSCSALGDVIPCDPNTPYDMKSVITQLLDDRHLFEIMPDYVRTATHLWCPSLPVMPDYCECDGD